MIVRSGSSWIMPGSYNVWEIDIIRVSGGNILPIRCTRRKKREGRDTGILLPRAVCNYGGDLSFVESVLRDQILGETLGHHPSKDGSGAGVSLR